MRQLSLAMRKANRISEQRTEANIVRWCSRVQNEHNTRKCSFLFATCWTCNTNDRVKNHRFQKSTYERYPSDSCLRPGYLSGDPCELVPNAHDPRSDQMLRGAFECLLTGSGEFRCADAPPVGEISPLVVRDYASSLRDMIGGRGCHTALI